jgi:hypothetical protein
VNQLALSKTQTLALSVTRNSPYRQPCRVPAHCLQRRNIAPSNLTNKESFGFLLTGRLSRELRTLHLSGAILKKINNSSKQEPLKPDAFLTASSLLGVLRSACRPHMTDEIRRCVSRMRDDRGLSASATAAATADRHAVAAFVPAACNRTSGSPVGILTPFHVFAN